MGKKIKETIKMQLPGGEVSLKNVKFVQVFSMKGIRNNIDSFCDKYNELTKNEKGKILSVHIHIYDDKTIDFKVKGEVTTYALLKLINTQKGSGMPNQIKIGTVSRNDIRKIAERKMPYLNVYTLEDAEKTIEATAVNMGIDIE